MNDDNRELFVKVRVFAESVDRHHDETTVAIVECQRDHRDTFGEQGQKIETVEYNVERRFEVLERRLIVLASKENVLETKLDAIMMLVIRMNHQLDRFVHEAERRFRAIEDRLS